ncbi:hypothetical protein BS47DRAFT_1379546 [Hydnum rufescens UP504]|uniref:Uncharacterized protein n=1 Tax=Hydnum rufescens UP504 TaxID=1448309 RepID=A0A9P6B7K9_9AGAM|nr:hypothetical protein BS47DRAFT_1379546 [Hydnum rufescens UP504]
MTEKRQQNQSLVVAFSTSSATGVVPQDTLHTPQTLTDIPKGEASTEKQLRVFQAEVALEKCMNVWREATGMFKPQVLEHRESSIFKGPSLVDGGCYKDPPL